MGQLSLPHFIPYKDILVGDSATKHFRISHQDVLAFSHLMGDTHSFHVVDAYAQQTVFKRRICHGVHLLAFVSALIGEQLPGFGTIYCSQDITFLQPIDVDEQAMAEVKVMEKLGRSRVKLQTRVYRADGTLAMEGAAVVKTHA